MPFLLLITAAMLFALGGLFMKYSVGLTEAGPSVLVFVCFCAGAACQALAMKRAEMGTVYVLVLGLEAIAAFSLGWILLHERITAAKACALVLILAGIALLDRTS